MSCDTASMLSYFILLLTILTAWVLGEHKVKAVKDNALFIISYTLIAFEDFCQHFVTCYADA